MAPHLIQLKNISKEYVNGDVITPVLHNINLLIERGEFVALMGPSGSGKSTLMHILGFLDQPTTGKYVFNGENVAEADAHALAKRRLKDVGFVFQAFHLLPHATVLENVMLPLVYQGVSNGERKRVAMKALEAVGLGDRASHLPNHISGGQRQRVAIARALVNDPSVIFADEPTGNLDSKSSEQVMEILEKLHKDGRTIVMVTHEHDVAEHAKRILQMKDGVILKDSKHL
ncbi:MAG: ABC transporter ATP-binding protein [Patescibacteria group bacterium]